MPAKRRVIVYSIDENAKSSEFVIDLRKNLDDNYGDYLIIEASRDCPIRIKLRGTTYQKWSKGMKKNVPLVIETSFPAIEKIKLSPTSSTNFDGWVSFGPSIGEDG